MARYFRERQRLCPIQVTNPSWHERTQHGNIFSFLSMREAHSLEAMPYRATLVTFLINEMKAEV